MTPAIIKIGTMPSRHYFLRGPKSLSEYKTGERISFREQGHGERWEAGRITGWKLDMPLVDRE